MRACVFTHATAAQTNAQNFVNAINAVLGYPRDGVNAATGQTETRFGRTLTWCVPFKHPNDGTRYAVVFKDRLMLLTTAAAEARIVLGTVTAPAAAAIVPMSLTQAQYDTLRAKLLTSVELTADWFPT